MKYLDEYRDPGLARSLLAEIEQFRRDPPWVIMEVCGGQTHSLLRHGLDEALAGIVELIHGPGCPVCVTAAEAIDFAQWLVHRPEVILTTFGDMLRVPGSQNSLQQVRSGCAGTVQMVYSPLDAVQLARQRPEREVVFFAVGFETTAPATALAVIQAAAAGIRNFSLLTAHVRVQPAMELLVQADDCRIDGFLAAGHVCTITGYTGYESFVRQFQRPVAVTGFEPVDLLLGIRECLRMLTEQAPEVRNCYGRTVRPGGNEAAQEIMNRVFEPANSPWRGLGRVPGGGLQLRPEWQAFDARLKFPQWIPLPQVESTECRSGEVLAGKIKPRECPQFGTACTPEHPLGPPMVSSEGACAAYFRYGSPPSTVETSSSLLG